MQKTAFSKPWLRVSFLAAATAIPAAVMVLGNRTPGPSPAYAQQAAVADEVAGKTDSAAIAQAQSLSTAFRDVAKIAKPSVVSITSLVEMKGRRGMNRRGNNGLGGSQLPPGLPEEFYEFFNGRGFGGQVPQAPQSDDEAQSQGPVERGTGSGVIVSPNGYIVTNNHVVEGSDQLKVQLSDDREFDATVVGTDPKSDLAVIKIEASGLVASKLGDSSIVEVGDWVVAIGSPFGLSQTVTAGIVSATNRVDFKITDYDDLIQTDAAINPGNSGGPLLNLQGECIGINTAIASRDGGFNGIGFAIPASMVDRVLQDILKEGHVVRGFIGTAIADTAASKEEFGIDKDAEGVVVSAVGREGPAEKAGIMPGDLIVAIDGTKMTNSIQLRQFVAGLRPGTTAKFEIVRDGKPSSVTVTIEEQSDMKLASINGSAAETMLGVKVSPVSKELAEEMRLKRSSGLLVEEVAASSIFAQGSDPLVPGEIVLSVNGKPVESATDFVKAVESSEGVIRLVVVNETSQLLKVFRK